MCFWPWQMLCWPSVFVRPIGDFIADHMGRKAALNALGGYVLGSGSGARSACCSRRLTGPVLYKDIRGGNLPGRSHKHLKKDRFLGAASSCTFSVLNQERSLLFLLDGPLYNHGCRGHGCQPVRLTSGFGWLP